jgi:hypothetical protein
LKNNLKQVVKAWFYLKYLEITFYYQ